MLVLLGLEIVRFQCNSSAHPHPHAIEEPIQGESYILQIVIDINRQEIVNMQ